MRRKVILPGHFNDSKPEHHEYRDGGCKYADDYLGEGKKSSCLNCPFYPDPCIYDRGKGYMQRLKIEQRTKQVIKLWKQGRKPEELMGIFKVSRKTIDRAISGQR